MKILIADDETPKLSRLEEFVKATYPLAEVQHARSVRTAIEAMQTCIPSLVILDMSLPTFDVAPGEPGGRPQGFGGIEVLRYMDFYGFVSPVIVVTQYEAFTDKGKNLDLQALSERMMTEHGLNFRGCVYFGRVHEDWQASLKAKMLEVLGETKS